MQNEEIYKTILEMTQRSMHSSRDWTIMTNKSGLQSFHYAMIDFTQEKKFDEDLAKCILRWTLKQGGVLKIRREDGDMIAQIDQMIIKGHMHNEFIKKLIQPLMEELENKVYSTRDQNGINTVTGYNNWYSRLPGVTKIKIKGHRGSGMYGGISYTLNHKMGRNGGRNYHRSGGFYGLDKPKD
jgi:hypothetical protein